MTNQRQNLQWIFMLSLFPFLCVALVLQDTVYGVPTDFPPQLKMYPGKFKLNRVSVLSPAKTAGTASRAAGPISISIVDGADAQMGQIPYQAMMVIPVTNDADPANEYYALCGCSLISKYYFLTAAHCCNASRAKESTIYWGFTDLNNLGEPFDYSDLSSLNTHPKFDPLTLDHDMCVGRLQSPADFSSPMVQPIQLAPKGNPMPFKCNVSGWGSLSENGDNPDVLQWLSVDKVPNENTSYGDLIDNTTMSCYRKPTGGDSCQGDSGGPLTTLYSDSASAVLVGVVSWGYGCDKPDYPGVYCKVSYFADWIQDSCNHTATIYQPQLQPQPTTTTTNTTPNTTTTTTTTTTATATTSTTTTLPTPKTAAL